MARVRLQGLAQLAPRRPGHPDAFVVAPFDADWPAGHACALLGPPGCGHVALLALVAGLARPDRGQVRFDDQDVTDWSPAARRVALVQRRPVVYPRLTVREQLAFPLRGERIAADALAARVHRIAEILGFSDHLESRAEALPTALRVRVAIGRALVRDDAPIMLLDDPLAGVAPSERPELRRLLARLRRELPRTWLYATAEPDDAATFADEIVVMAHGTVLQRGPVQALYRTPAHRDVGRVVGDPGINLLPIRIADREPRIGGQPLHAAPAQLGRWLAAQQAVAPSATLALGLHPDAIRLVDDDAPGSLDADVVGVLDLGAELLLSVRVGDVEARVRVPSDHPRAAALAAASSPRATVRLALIHRDTHVFRDAERIE